MKDNDATLYKRLRAEMVGLLGFAEPLTTAQGVKVDLVASLRLALDHFTGLQLAGEKVDTAKLLSCAESLERLLPSTAGFDTTVAESSTARNKIAVLIEALAGTREDDKADEVLELKAAVADLSSQVAEKNATITALTGSLPAPTPAPASPTPAAPQPEPQVRSPQPPLPKPSASPPAHYLADHSREPWRVYERGRDRWSDNRT